MTAERDDGLSRTPAPTRRAKVAALYVGDGVLDVPRANGGVGPYKGATVGARGNSAGEKYGLKLHDFSGILFLQRR